MPVRVGFCGFRHMHLFDVYARVLKRPGLEVAAICEEEAATREVLRERGIPVSHESLRSLLAAPFDLLVVGEPFGRRGRVILEALRSGRHVLSDKPLCTRVEELEEIRRESRLRGLAVGAVLELRDSGIFIRLRELFRSGSLGEVLAVAFGGQHPLLPGQRPQWYFQPGMHGGTLNDLAIHALDAIPWLTGREVRRVVAARCWNAGLPERPEFRNAAQVMLSLEGGAGVVGDVSYLSPDSFGYALPLYWRFTFWCSRGVAEAGLNLPEILVYRQGASRPERLAPAEGRPGGYLEEICGRMGRGESGAEELFRATHAALVAQQAADRGLADLAV